MPVRKHGLSPKQTEILQALALGKTRMQVADDLGISAHTLDTHLSRSFIYLGVSNLVEAVSKLQEQLFPRKW